MSLSLREALVAEAWQKKRECWIFRSSWRKTWPERRRLDGYAAKRSQTLVTSSATSHAASTQSCAPVSRAHDTSSCEISDPLYKKRGSFLPVRSLCVRPVPFSLCQRSSFLPPHSGSLPDIGIWSTSISQCMAICLNKVLVAVRCVVCGDQFFQ